MRSLSRIVKLVAFLLTPSPMRFLFRPFGWSVHPTSKVGLSLILVDELNIEAYASIGHLNVIKNLKRLDLGASASIGHMNWMSGFLGHIYSDMEDFETQRNQVVLREGAALTHRHSLDCTGKIEIGSFTTIAGWGSRIITHGIDIFANRQAAHNIWIGSHCMVGTSVLLIGPLYVSNRTLVAPGAVARGDYLEENSMLGGIPARTIKILNVGDVRYFTRENPSVR